VCFVVHKTTSKLEHVILTTLFLSVLKTPTVGAPGRGICSTLFSLDILIVTSPKVSFVANGINLTGASLAPGKTIQFSYLEFTADRLGHLSLYPKERDSAAIFIGVVHSGSPSLHTTLEDSSDKDGAASSTVGSSRSPGP
jgi:hypothetical protein